MMSVSMVGMGSKRCMRVCYRGRDRGRPVYALVRSPGGRLLHVLGQPHHRQCKYLLLLLLLYLLRPSSAKVIPISLSTVYSILKKNQLS